MTAHSPQYFLINPEGQWATVYTPPLAKGQVMEDLVKIIEREREKSKSRVRKP